MIKVNTGSSILELDKDYLISGGNFFKGLFNMHPHQEEIDLSDLQFNPKLLGKVLKSLNNDISIPHCKVNKYLECTNIAKYLGYNKQIGLKPIHITYFSSYSFTNFGYKKIYIPEQYKLFGISYDSKGLVQKLNNYIGIDLIESVHYQDTTIVFTFLNNLGTKIYPCPDSIILFTVEDIIMTII